MSESVVEFVDGVDGVRGGVAEAVGQQFATVADLSDAQAETLTAVKGVGPVLAERILAAARTAVIADHTPESEPEPDPATRAQATVAQAKASTRPALELVEGEAREQAAQPEEEAPAPSPTPTSEAEETHLPPVVQRLASLVGTTIGWSIRLYRTVTQPVQHLLHRG